MGGDADPVGIVNQGVSRNARLRLVHLAEPAVNDNQPPVCLDGVFPVFNPHRHMAVDNVGILPGKAEFLQNPQAGFFVLVVDVIGVFPLFAQFRVADKQPLKGGHFPPAEQGRTAAAPQKPEEILPPLAFRRAPPGVIPLPGHGFGVVNKGFAGQHLPVHVKLGEGTVLLHGDTAVEQQVLVAAEVHPALGVEEFHMLLQLLALLEGKPQLGHDLGLFLA